MSAFGVLGDAYYTKEGVEAGLPRDEKLAICILFLYENPEPGQPVWGLAGDVLTFCGLIFPLIRSPNSVGPFLVVGSPSLVRFVHRLRLHCLPSTVLFQPPFKTTPPDVSLPHRDDL